MEILFLPVFLAKKDLPAGRQVGTESLTRRDTPKLFTKKITYRTAFFYKNNWPFGTNLWLLLLSHYRAAIVWQYL